ncbi:hypothetical protein BDN72DRAFT_104731 [Pluteus cervinus]|uniref:Uncharacterized protein n=1 Tax=Pluteus cervinus TaxID=181527 RepID=A0ACD3B7B3_9AGAR|nr:hypothetical protein BDN72DRAFT_104731 [Pluteus cervinus]
MKRSVEGPGIWVSCVKGKEKQTIGELTEVLDSLIPELWPGHGPDDDVNSENEGDDDNIEAQVAKEMSAMKDRKKDRLFANCPTNTNCVVFISCKPPVDPVELVVHHIKNVLKTGVTRTRYIHRLVPVSGSCVTNLPEMQALCNTLLERFFQQHPGKVFRYKIELRVRNHTTLSRQTIIQNIAQDVPSEHTVDLTNPDMFILVEVFKSVCGISIVEDYYELQKFNVMELANQEKAREANRNPGRVETKSKERNIVDSDE